MRFLPKIMLIGSLALIAGQAALAFPQHSSEDIDDEANVREDSVVIEGWEFEDFEVKIPRFIKLKSNRI